MAATDFSNGTVVTPTFLDSIFHTSGGHVHDGADDDGHAPQINLASHVTGSLPLANIADIAEADFNSAACESSPSRTLTLSNRRGRVRKVGGMAMLHWKMLFSGDGDMNYVRVTLPSGYSPSGTYFYDMNASKVACVSKSGATYTDVEGLYAAVYRDSGTDYLYIGNKELVDQAPTTTSFSGSTDYYVRVNHIYRLA